jgi:hypothetical protein
MMFPDVPDIMTFTLILISSIISVV